jgi:VIT1/CCC1 family predicted Fe2+/Mn2+ transporter
MDILLWIIQGLLALLCLAGGGTKVFKFDEMAKQPPMTAIPLAGWRALGLVEMLGAILLIVPAAISWMPELTVVAAAVLALENFILATIYAKHSFKLVASNPLVWAVIIGLLAAFVSYGRFALSPIT